MLYQAVQMEVGATERRLHVASLGGRLELFSPRKCLVELAFLRISAGGGDRTCTTQCTRHFAG